MGDILHKAAMAVMAIIATAARRPNDLGTAIRARTARLMVRPMVPAPMVLMARPLPPMAAYKARAEAVRRAEVYRKSFAISICPGEEVESPTIVGAQAANELLNVIGIKASFVLTEYNGRIFVSARSIDEINVQLIMERLGGGGHLNVAGAQLTDCTMEEAKQIIQDTLDEMLKEGDIER